MLEALSLRPWGAPRNSRPGKAVLGLATGRSMFGTRVGSYSVFCSRANMVLFLTREAFCRRSMEERRVGEGEAVAGPYRLVTSAELRFCQKRRVVFGVALPSSGDGWNGDESVLTVIFCRRAACVSSGVLPGMRDGGETGPTLADWFQLGELRRFSVAEISDSGRELALLVGEGAVWPLEMRSGCVIWTRRDGRCQHGCGYNQGRGAPVRRIRCLNLPLLQWPSLVYS